MKKEIYETPVIRVVSVTAEGPLCSSPMKLPDVEWKDETEW